MELLRYSRQNFKDLLLHTGAFHHKGWLKQDALIHIHMRQSKLAMMRMLLDEVNFKTLS